MALEYKRVRIKRFAQLEERETPECWYLPRRLHAQRSCSRGPPCLARKRRAATNAYGSTLCVQLVFGANLKRQLPRSRLVHVAYACKADVFALEALLMFCPTTHPL